MEKLGKRIQNSDLGPHMLTKTRGIVFRKVNYGETSLIVDIFTLEYGLMPYIISGVRKPRARTGQSLLQLMAIVDLVAYHSEKSKLHRIREAQSAYVFENIPGDVRKNAIIMFMAELCSKVIRQTERHDALYHMIEQTIIDLDQASRGFADAHLIFMIRLANHLGFGPEASHDADQNTFDLLEGRFISGRPGHEYYILDSVLFDTYLVAARDPEVRVNADRESRNRILDTLILYYQLHIDKMPEMHAHRILRDVL